MAEYPLPASSELAPNIEIRRANPSDINSMADSFFRSFSPSHKFWAINFPESSWHSWWVDAWKLGIEKDSSARTFVAVDKEQDPGRVVGFARWIVPQDDGNLHRLWPDLPGDADMEIMGAFFGGMDENRRELMGVEPHWFLEMLGTDTDYQGKGIGYTFTKWGCDLADKSDMRVYIDASEKGAPFYQKHFGAVKRKIVIIPDKPVDDPVHYEYWTHVVPRKSERESMAKV